MFESSAFPRMIFGLCRSGFARMSGEAQDILRLSVSASQTESGLFRGRGGQPDLYYTAFGVLLSMASGAKINSSDCLARLEQIHTESLDLVHLCALTAVRRALPLTGKRGTAALRALISGWKTMDDMRKSIAALPDSAYPQNDPYAPYSQFLLSAFSGSAYQPDFAALRECRLPNGLYSNFRRDPNCGLNASAAALFLLNQPERDESAQALLKLQNADGSFSAGAQAQGGDLLSTASACIALHHCGMTPKRSPKTFLQACFREDAFFAAVPDDPLGDIEYTVYGLAVMGAIS